MRYIIAAFRSQNEAVEALYMLQAVGIKATLDATPSSARVGCGVSLRMDGRDADRVKTLLSGQRLSTFAGLFSVVDGSKGIIVTRL